MQIFVEINKKLFQQNKLSKKIYTVYLEDPSLFTKLEKFKFSPYSANYSMFSLSDYEYSILL